MLYLAKNTCRHIGGFILGGIVWDRRERRI